MTKRIVIAILGSQPSIPLVQLARELVEVESSSDESAKKLKDLANWGDMLRNTLEPVPAKNTRFYHGINGKRKFWEGGR